MGRLQTSRKGSGSLNTICSSSWSTTRLRYLVVRSQIISDSLLSDSQAITPVCCC